VGLDPERMAILVPGIRRKSGLVNKYPSMDSATAVETSLSKHLAHAAILGDIVPVSVFCTSDAEFSMVEDYLHFMWIAAVFIECRA
jgi:hypothetical protein